MGKALSPHDHFFRTAMSEHRVAKPFFEQHLPEAIRKIIDLDTLQLKNESFIDPQLKLSITDMLFSADFAGKPGYLYLLQEHRSTPNRWQAFTMLVYIVQIMQYHRKQIKKQKGKKEQYLPLVYPIVFFNGAVTYPYSTDLLDLFDHPRELVQQILFHPFQLIDLSTISDKALKINTWPSILHIVMKHIHSSDILPYMEGLANALREVDQEEGEDYLTAVFNYVFTASETRNLDSLLKVAQENLSTNLREGVMTIAKQLEERGRQKGWQEGRHEGWQEGEITKAKNIAIRGLEQGMTIDQIVRLTDLPFEIVRNLEKEKITS